MSQLPTSVGPLAEGNTPGACKLQFVAVEKIASFPKELRGTLPTAIVLKDGEVWTTITPTKFTQDFQEEWVIRNGDQFARASLGFRLPKDRVLLLDALWQLKPGRYVVLHHDLNGTIKVLGTKTEPATVRVEQLQHGADPRREGNRYVLQVEVSRRTECPFYLAAPPPVVPSGQCPTLAQQLAEVNWATIEGLLSSGQLAAAVASLCESCPTLATLIAASTWAEIEVLLSSGQLTDAEASICSTLCELIDEAFETATTPIDALLVSGATESGVTNGVYPRLDTYNGKPRYRIGSAYSSWSGTAWWITYDDATGSFYSTDNTDFPWQATGWTAFGSFSAPIPTVAQATEPGGAPTSLLDCLSTEQGTALFTALLVDRAWSAIEELLSPEQLEAAEASLGGGSCPSLCELIDAAFSGGEPEDAFTSSGAADEELNGNWSRLGTSGGKGYYTCATAECLWSGTTWYLQDNEGSTILSSTQNVDYPWQVTEWLLSGSPYAITLTQVGGADLEAGAETIAACLSSEQAEALVAELGGGAPATVRSADSSPLYTETIPSGDTLTLPQLRITKGNGTTVDVEYRPASTSSVHTEQNIIHMPFRALDALSAVYVVDSDTAGVYTTETNDGSSGTVTWQRSTNSGSSYSNLTAPYTLAAGDWIRAERTISTSAGWARTRTA